MNMPNKLDDFQKTALVMVLQEMMAINRDIDCSDLQEYLCQHEESVMLQLDEDMEAMGCPEFTDVEFYAQWCGLNGPATDHALIEYADNLVDEYAVDWPLYRTERARIA